MKNKNISEITPKAIILGILLSMILGAANAYLGLFAGMTVSASIPAAIISMSILRIFKNSNILENNIVQTAASAGESLAAGVIFTVPALVLMGYWTNFDYFEIFKIACLGGIIGVLFTIPLRRALIVEKKLLFPEGLATAEILKVGHNKKIDGGMKILFISSLIGGLMKFSQEALTLWYSAINGATRIGNLIFGFGCSLSPALIGVGYIIGRNISILVFIGGLLSWIIAIPIYSYIYPIQGDSLETAWYIWNTKIRYLGVGAMLVGGIWSLFSLINPIINGIKSSIVSIKRTDISEIPLEEKDVSIKYVGWLLIACTIPLFMLYLDIINSYLISGLLTIIMLIFGFLFSAVASYMAGTVGSSNNPISGVTIATILFSSLLLLLILGAGSTEGAVAAILIGSVVCCAAAIGGDNLQDLKTGYIVGATPWKQQVMQIIGTISAALSLGFVLQVLHSAYVIGEGLKAPQATLMQSVAEGVFNGSLPWNMVYFGMLIGVIIIILDIYQKKKNSSFRLPVLAVAVGIYLPIELSTPIFIGGILSSLTNKYNSNNRGILFASGLITGEALIGILLAVPIFISGNPGWWPNFNNYNFIGLVLFILMILYFYNFTKKYL
tara:strand:- start:1141 stop:2973 length:1833 start_codon:yes stop_codon:yes gene_type:complete